MASYRFEAPIFDPHVPFLCIDRFPVLACVAPGGRDARQPERGDPEEEEEVHSASGRGGCGWSAFALCELRRL